MGKFYKYGRWWFTTRVEAETARGYNERIYYDEGMRAYYIVRPQQRGFWVF